MVKGLAAVTQDAIRGAPLLMGREDKQQHDKGADVSGDCSGYGGSMEPPCNLNLDDRRELDTLHVMDDLQEMDGSAPPSQESRGTPPRLFLSQYLLYIWPLFPASRT